VLGHDGNRGLEVSAPLVACPGGYRRAPWALRVNEPALQQLQCVWCDTLKLVVLCAGFWWALVVLGRP